MHLKFRFVADQIYKDSFSTLQKKKIPHETQYIHKIIHTHKIFTYTDACSHLKGKHMFHPISSSERLGQHVLGHIACHYRKRSRKCEHRPVLTNDLNPENRNKVYMKYDAVALAQRLKKMIPRQFHCPCSYSDRSNGPAGSPTRNPANPCTRSPDDYRAKNNFLLAKIDHVKSN